MTLPICSHNLTLGIFVGSLSNYMEIKNGNLVGLIGKFYNRLIVSKNQRYNSVNDLKIKKFDNQRIPRLMNIRNLY